MATTKFYHGKVKYKLGYFTQYRHCHRHRHLHHYDNDNNNNYLYFINNSLSLDIFCCSKAIRVEKESKTKLICLIKT